MPSQNAPLHCVFKLIRGTNSKNTSEVPWTLSTTELLCSRMHCWESALECYNFLRRQCLPVADEAIFSVYIRLRTAHVRQLDAPRVKMSVTSALPLRHPVANSELSRTATAGESTYENTISSTTPANLPLPVAFLLDGAQYQPALSSLFHRLHFVVQSVYQASRLNGKSEHSCERTSHCSPSEEQYCDPLMKMLSVLSSPCAIINLSLDYNLRRKRWSDVLRIIHNLHNYKLLEPFLSEIYATRALGDVDKLLGEVVRDPYYRRCVEVPSLVSLMETLLMEWEAYWDVVKGTTEAERMVTQLLGFRPPDSDSGATTFSADVNQGNGCTLGCENTSDSTIGAEYENGGDTPNPLCIRSTLEECSVEVLHFVGFVTHTVEVKGDEQSDEDVFHRLVEMTTRNADYALCCRLATAWVQVSQRQPPFGTRLPSTASKLLLLARLFARSPSLRDVLKILHEWCPILLIGCDSGGAHLTELNALSAVLCFPEVVTALVKRLPPSVVKEEVVEKVLSRSSVVLNDRARNVVAGCLLGGGFHDTLQEFSSRQACLELAELCRKDGPGQPSGAFIMLMRTYFSGQSAVQERMHLLCDLLKLVDEPFYPNVVDALVNVIHRESPSEDMKVGVADSPSVLFDAICNMVVQYHRVGDAAFLFRVTVDTIRGRGTTSFVNHCGNPSEAASHPSRIDLVIQDAVKSFTAAVAHLGFVVECAERSTGGGSDTALQWLRLLSEVPSTLFDEPTLVVWLFWAMRALTRQEEGISGRAHSLTTGGVTKADILNASANLSKSFINCEKRAVFPPMLLHWLVSNADMTWSEATKWLVAHAGLEASETRRFAFIRLPLGDIAVQHFGDVKSRDDIFLAVEEELRKHIFSRCSPMRSVNSPHESGVEEDMQKLFQRIRYTLLRTWYYRLHAPCTIASKATAGFMICGSFSSLGPIAMRSTNDAMLHNVHYDALMCSIQKALRCLMQVDTGVPNEIVES
uniref:Uncharacterized protein n=1 Tax=Trypanosoma congolense (strain IL3000) TaxID=1068625 RepID=G0UQ36_TRYCI|nr:conserved hypothetical protein [Trypanosoma congolense IL3000]